MQNADLGWAGWPAFRAAAMVRSVTIFYLIGMGLLIPEVSRFLAGPLHQGDSVVGASVAAFSVAAVLLAAGRLSPGGRTGAVAAVIAGYDIGNGAAAAGLGPVADRAGYPAMSSAAALLAAAGAALAPRIVDSSQRGETP